MNTSIKVTVFIPVYNGEKYLQECVDSILNQTFQNFECLIIDDGSSDSSLDIIRSFTDSRIRLIKNERNIGIAKTRNKGFDLAQGEYIAFIDCDDISAPTRLEKQVAFMDAHPEVGICGSWIQEIYPTGEPIPEKLRRYPATDEKIREMMFWDCPLWNPSLIFRKRVIEQHALRHNADFISASDFDLFVKAARVTKLANIPEILHFYRRHENQITTHRGFEANRNANLVRANLILQEIKQHIPDIQLELLEGVNMRQLTSVQYFEKLVLVDHALARLDNPAQPEQQKVHRRLKRYLNVIWLNALFHLPQYDMAIYALLRQSNFFKMLSLRTQMIYQIKSLLGMKKVWVKRLRSFVFKEKQLAWN